MFDTPSMADSGKPLMVGPDGRLVRLADGSEIDLTRRKALRRIVRQLADIRLSAAGTALSVEDVLAAGWPGEKVLPDSGRQ
jgi:hypothetical protein